jgi:hypothetical protein
MTRTPVQSSNIVSVGYNPDTAELEIEFSSGVYRYAGVPADQHQQFMAAQSLGRHFAAHIKKQFACKRVELLPVLVAGEPCHGEVS